jgi:MinD superfamily P-loop ATPase
MKQIVIISGKGGTGKTVLTASFAALGENKVLADCDVDAADLHLILHPEIKDRHEFRSGQTAAINGELCQQCGECIAVCRFGAINDEFYVDPVSCEGCAVCSHVCPEEAISMEENMSGEWYVSDTKYGPMVHAKLGIAEENSGKLVSLVRQNAKKIADEEKRDYVLIDGPPGIGCPVIASITDTDLAVIVTEPTLSGIHDMQRVVQVAKHFNIPVKVIINKYDINTDNSDAIKEMCTAQDIEIVAQIPFSEKASESIVSGTPLVEYADNSITEGIKSAWKKIKRIQ